MANQTKKGCVKHDELWHKEHIEYDGMNEGMVNQDEKIHDI
jgi:hypothetical protein